jgi:transglutaminase-like putative cysteine protease
MRDFPKRLKKSCAIIVTAALLIPVYWLRGGANQQPAPPDKVRVVEFTYHTDLTGIDPKAHHLEAWIPLPREDRFQQVTEVRIESGAHTEVVAQPAYGNQVVHLSEAMMAPLPKSILVTIHFKVRRVEESPDLTKAQRNLSEPRDGKFIAFLAADRLVPIDGEISQVSTTIGDTEAPMYQQAKAIYEYVVATMSYDKSGTGWGRGDAIYACNVKKGNCTDFHSLFIAIARSRGIPARFTIGFPLGPAPSGEIAGYHCWAEFYSGGRWVPVDASEAWKHPERRQYYFGHLDADRVAFTMGRDLLMKPSQHGEPLNFLIYPYVEVDGNPLPQADARNQFEYVDMGEQN